MTVATETSVHRAEFGEMTYHFCGAGCRTRFLAGPEEFASSPDAGTPRGE
jgi:Cu+-exporting ATPase